jgi:hypothetical protein
MAEEAGSRNTGRPGAITRRDVVVGGGSAAVAGGVAAAIAVSADEDEKDGGEDRLNFGLIGRVDQVGRSVTAMAYLTNLRGFRTSLLYTRPRGHNSIDPSTSDPSTARLTMFCEATVEGMSTVGAAIASVLEGDARIYFQPDGGARFAEPRSFARGRQIASFRGTFQNNLAVDAPDRAAVGLAADLTQEGAGRLELDGTSRRFGRKGLAWSLRATGRGERLERNTPRARLLISGDMEVLGGLR